jgi:hypothetical protein
MLGTPREHLEFPLWYLRRRGWVEILPNGLLAITVDGVDRLGSKELALPNDRLLTEPSLDSEAKDGSGRRVIEAHGRGVASESPAVG